MGMSVAGGGGGGRRRRGVPRYSAMADINMTPFIDVMLVLLIIFMVAAPLLSTSVVVDLPSSNGGASKSDSKPVAISVDDKGVITIGDDKVALEQLTAKLLEKANNNLEEQIVLRGDKAASYGQVAAVMNLVKEAGFKKLGIVSNPSAK